MNKRWVIAYIAGNGVWRVWNRKKKDFVHFSLVDDNCLYAYYQHVQATAGKTLRKCPMPFVTIQEVYVED